MSTRFSLIYPTRHRPAFIKYALRFLEKQHYDNFEVIISDNYVDPSLSCQNVCNNSVLPDLKYIHPPTPLGMVENWNYAYQFASGEYILYFTDKMFLLPDLLSRADVCVQNLRPDIISWVDNPYRPLKPPQYFDKGFYVKASASVPKKPGVCIL